MTGRNPNPDFIPGFQQGTFRFVREIYILHYTELCSFAWQLIQDEQEVKNIVLDTFIKLVQRRESFDSLANIKAFLYITVRNASLNYLRYHKEEAGGNNKNPFSQLAEADSYLATDCPNADISSPVKAAIQALPSPTQEVFNRMYGSAEYVADVAKHLEMEAAEVVNHKTKALYLLQNMLAEKSAHGALLLIYYLAVVHPGNRLANAS